MARKAAVIVPPDEVITSKSDWAFARLRTETYLGGRDPHGSTVLSYAGGVAALVETTWVPAVFTAFREIFDNAFDEYKKGYGSRIVIAYDAAEMVFSVEDDGRGIPIEWDAERGMHKATLAMAMARTGRNYVADRGEVAGTNGLGAKAVNYCSQWFELDIHRDKKRFRQTFREGDGVTDEHLVEDPYIVKNTKHPSGTRIWWKLSRTVFPHLLLPERFLEDRLSEVKLVNPKLEIEFNGRAIEPAPIPTCSPDRIARPGGVKSVVLDIDEDGLRSTFTLVPDFLAEGDHVHGLVNGIPIFDGGIHLDVFRKHFYTGMVAALEGVAKKRKLTPNRSDVSEGVLIFNITQMNNPTFNSQSKTRLTNEEAGKAVARYLGEDGFFQKLVRNNPAWVEAILARCAARTQARETLDVQKLTKRSLRDKNSKLIDATAADRDRQQCILILAEGDSAIGGMGDARTPKIHGGLALKGKPMNVFDVPLKKILEDDTLKMIMSAIGLQPGRKAHRGDLRYGKVYIAHDMDEDGFSIGALLILFFYRLWPELFDPAATPFFSIFMTPFIIAEKGKIRRYWYAHNINEFDAGAMKGWEITRAKGLSSLSSVDWAHALKTPVLKPIVDDGALSAALSLIFDKTRADDRKVWIGM